MVLLPDAQPRASDPAPSHKTRLSPAVGETHRRYSAYINARLRVTGHLFQGRFGCVAMDEAHLLAAFRYVALNPVKAGLTATAADWPWSSTPVHLKGQSDGLVDVQPLRQRVEHGADLLAMPPEPECEAGLTQGQAIGRPLMAAPALAELEQRLGRSISPGKRGRPAKQQADLGTLKLV